MSTLHSSETPRGRHLTRLHSKSFHSKNFAQDIKAQTSDPNLRPHKKIFDTSASRRSADYEEFSGTVSSPWVERQENVTLASFHADVSVSTQSWSHHCWLKSLLETSFCGYGLSLQDQFAYAYPSAKCLMEICDWPNLKWPTAMLPLVMSPPWLEPSRAHLWKLVAPWVS